MLPRTGSAPLKCVRWDWAELAQGLICSVIFQRLPMCRVLVWDMRSLALGNVEFRSGR